MKNKKFFLLIILLSFYLGIKGAYVAFQDRIYVLQAGYFLKKNEISKAQEFYEKAFRLGFNNHWLFCRW